MIESDWKAILRVCLHFVIFALFFFLSSLEIDHMRHHIWDLYAAPYGLESTEFEKSQKSNEIENFKNALEVPRLKPTRNRVRNTPKISYRGRPLMIAISVMLRSNYDCNLFCWGTNMSANIEMLLLTRFVQKWGLEVLSAIFEITVIFVPSHNRLQS